jgi:hypothetical protein
LATPGEEQGQLSTGTSEKTEKLKKVGKGTISIVPLSPLEMDPRFSA